jgi:two-component system invasion response regulator UvrY
MIKVMVADDHTVVRDGIRHLLEEGQDIKVIAQANNGQEAVEEYKRNLPDVAILDISMPVMNGLEACKCIKSLFPNAKILILTMHPEEEYAVRFLKAGALGYVTKTVSAQELQKAVKLVAQNRLYVSDSSMELVMTQLLYSKQDNASPISLLSDREAQVFDLLVHGKKVRDIATELTLSVRTVENYRYRIFSKLNIRRTVDLVAFAYQHNQV